MPQPAWLSLHRGRFPVLRVGSGTRLLVCRGAIFLAVPWTLIFVQAAVKREASGNGYEVSGEPDPSRSVKCHGAGG